MKKINPQTYSTVETTVDSLFDGKIMVMQGKDGYRFSLDTVLLAGFIWVRRGETIIDLGTGVGIVPLILAIRRKCVKEIIGVEIQDDLAALAEANVALNCLGEVITILRGDIKGLKDIFSSSSFNVVVTNPPYYRVSSGRINKNTQKLIARHEVACTIHDTLETASFLLKKGGRIFIIFPAHRAITLVCSMRSFALEPKRIRWVHSREGEDAKFFLVEAHKEGGEGTEVMTPLFLYSEDGQYTQEMEDLYNTEVIMARKGA